MMPTLNDFMAPDMQKILFFMLPAIGAVGSLTMNLSRGFETKGTVFMVICALVAIYFLPQFLEVF